MKIVIFGRFLQPAEIWICPSHDFKNKFHNFSGYFAKKLWDFAIFCIIASQST